MMPDRYEEMKKRLMLEKQQVASPEIDYNQAVDDSGTPIIKEEPIVIEPSSKDRLAAQDKSDLNRQLSHLIVAAGPSLMGFMKGTSKEQSSRFDQANNYLKNVATIEATNSGKLEKIKNEEGKPEFIKQINSVGKEPYIPPLKIGNGQSAAGSYQAGVLYNPATNSYKQASFSTRENKFYDPTTGEPMLLEKGEIYKPISPKTYTTEDFQGSKSYKTKSPYRDQPSTFDSTKSELARLGPEIGKLEGKNLLNVAKKGKEKVAESLAVIGTLEASERLLMNTTDPMAFSIALGQALRSVEKRLSDQEQERFMGNGYRSIFQNAENYMQGKMGIIPPNIRDGVLESIRYLKSKEKAQVSSNQKSYSTTDGLNKTGKKTVKRASGQPEDANQRESNDWRGNLKGMYR